MKAYKWKICSWGVMFGVLSVATAQDMRQVEEPKIPGACVTLMADKFVGVDRQMAEADESKLDTARIQNALDHCAPGKSVELKETLGKNAFLTGPLQLREGVTLLVGKGITLFGSRNPKDYDYATTPNVCGTSETSETIERTLGNQRMPTNAMRPNVGPATPVGCRPLISIVSVSNAAVMGEGTIDGRGDMRLIGHDYSWWEMARKAEPGNKKYYSTRLIVANHADGLILYGIALHNSPNFHVSVNGTNGFTAWGVHIKTPTVVGTDARNTDGIDPGSSTNVTVAHSWIDNDDDNIAIKTGVTHMSVLHNHFYNGHGMSIGSETLTGDSFLLVDDLVEDHTTSGIRIKSNVTRGGLVHDMVYQNICMRDVQVPIAISPYYNNGTTDQFYDPGFKGDKIPHYKAIALRNITAITAGDVLIAGADENHRTEVTLENVHIEKITPEQVHLKLSDITYGETNIPLDKTLKGNAVKLISASTTKNNAYNCEGKFVQMW